MKVAMILVASSVMAVSAHAQDPRLKEATPQSRAAFICLAYGEGFAPIPGTDTCVRAGGDLEAAVLSSQLSGTRTPAGGGKILDRPGAPSRAGRGFTRTYGGAAIEVESHTPTDFGSIDAHVRVENWQPLSR